VLRALTAAGIEADSGTIPVLDVAHYGLAEKVWHDAVLSESLTETTGAEWPCETTLSDPPGADALYRHGDAQGVYRLPGGEVVLLHSGGGWFEVRAAASSRARAHAVVSVFRSLYPALYADPESEDKLTVPITFWVLSQFGPSRRLRRVETTRWENVAENYTGDVREQISGLVDGFTPGESGQLLLWHGPPGTGKTWALRALAHEWRSWAEFHCITDPDAFFVKDAAYMVDVLLSDSYDAIDPDDGSQVTVEGGEKWRVLVLEDTGELLSADAKERSGQGLSRLLNVVDGMIGQGLRILVLVTTNDAIETLHPAVTRQGRCASEILFAPLTADEATVWLGRTVDEPMTLADLYAAEDQEVEAAVLAAVEEVQLDPLTRAAVDAARAPLPDLPDDDDPQPAAGAAAASADPLVALSAAHDRTMAAFERIATREAADSRREFAERMAERSLEAVREIASRPAAAAPAPAPVVNVTLPEQPVSVNVEAPHVEAPVVNVSVPEQPAPVVNVAAPEAPNVDVHVAAAEAPVVNVTVPEQPKPEPPVVHVHPSPPPTARTLKISENPVTGVRTVTFDDEDDA
jgi:hypothetical protein